MLITPTIIDVPLRTDQDGVVRVGNTRVTLLVLIGAHNRGDTPEQIAEGFDTLKLEDIYAVISYYLSHRTEIDSYIERIKEEAEQRRQAHEANDPRAIAFNAKMRALLDAKHKQDQS